LEQVECDCGATGEILQASYFSFIYELEMKKVLQIIRNKDIFAFKYKLIEIMRAILV
jgi:hypothetical protein